MSGDAERAAIVREAASWLGTAFHHQGRVKAVRDGSGRIVEKGGVDCAQSVYLIARAAVPERVPEIRTADTNYSFQWNLPKGADETYLATVLAHATEIDLTQVKPGDLALFRFAHAWAHGAIVMPPGWPVIAHANAAAGVFMLDRATEGRLRGRAVRFFSLFPARQAATPPLAAP
jgi:cell wall-associated NlpC family hydrolase